MSGAGPRLTEERLKSWLDADQAQQKRLCVALLSLARGYTDVKPRRPKGGPDGARDLTAVFGDSLVIWGAVGFRNSVSDSTEDKRWVRKKFQDDLEDALNANGDLKGFVFFTNVDLTPAEQTQLADHARSKGIRKFELFYRERLRILLDSPEGLGFRYQYLGITLSDAEQAAFFGRFGSELERMVIQGFGVVDRKLARLEFLQSCGKQLFSMKLILSLKAPIRPEALGHFRALLQVMDFSIRDPHPALYLAVRDGYALLTSQKSEQLLPGCKTIAWSRNPDDKIQDTRLGSLRPGLIFQLQAGTGVHGKGPFRTLGDLDRKSLSLFLTKKLTDLVAGLAWVVNNYALVSLPIEVFRITECKNPLFDWPEELSEEEQNEPWMRLGLRNDGPNRQIYLERKFVVDFEEYTPEKVVGF